MKQVILKAARDMMKHIAARGVVIIYFSEDEYGYTSYGQTVPDCEDMRFIGDQIAERIDNGKIELEANHAGSEYIRLGRLPK